jgi:ferritin-like metal-binding protein YciE
MGKLVGPSTYIQLQKHYHDFKYNNKKSKFAIHLLENHHSIGLIDNIMEILYITRKGCTMEKFYIYKETKSGNQINDKNTVKQNRIFDATVQGETNRLCAHGNQGFW